MGSWALFMLRKAKLTAMKLGIVLTSIISLGVRQKLALAVVASEKLRSTPLGASSPLLSKPLGAAGCKTLRVMTPRRMQ